MRLIKLGDKNPFYNKKHTDETRLAMSLSHRDEKNVRWKGDKVGYISLHKWVRKNIPAPDLCPICNTSKPTEVHNISTKYTRDLSDWQWLCHRCHMLIDGRLFNNIMRFSK